MGRRFGSHSGAVLIIKKHTTLKGAPRPAGGLQGRCMKRLGHMVKGRKASLVAPPRSSPSKAALATLAAPLWLGCRKIE